MRIEQQNAGIVDVLKDSIGPEESKGLPEKGIYTQYGIAYGDKSVEKSGKGAKSVNLKDATYLKPGTEEKKTVAQEVEEAGTMDAAERKNQMAVLANTTSPEDYAKMQEEGFSLDETTSNTIVTETDKIKAQLAKAGVDISFFGDDLDMEQLEAIAGNPELALQLAQTLKQADIPCTEENIRDAMEAVALAGMLETPGDGAIKYMLDNELEPTIENLYKAENSGCGSYQTAGELPIDMSTFMDQVERIIEQAGLSVDERTLADSQWMLENEIPLNEENLKFLEALRNLTLPLDAAAVMESVATAISEGGRPQDAMLLGGHTMQDKAVIALYVVNQATDEDVAYLIDNGMELNVRNLSYAMASRGWNPAHAGEAAGQSDVQAAGEKAAQIDTTGAGEAAWIDTIAAGEAASGQTDGNVQGVYTREGLALLTARRQLEEARLAMTAQANYALLKKGIEIDTEPLAKLVEELKAEENAYYENLLKAQGVETSEENVALFRETTETVADLKTVPAYVLGMEEAKNAAVSEVHRAGKALQDSFERANERYETLMTAPRADLGDSIQKAFRNVDEILQDIGLETSEANRRAVRILGYNGLDITAENVAQMKAVDEEVQRAFRNLTPVAVMEMIRRGINPLDMDFTTLNETAEQIGRELGTEDNRKFGEFLWKLEKSNAISEEERASYIGTYRLIHQVEQSDGAAIGALVNQGAEITMRNLMMAVRSGHHSGKMDFSVDESFGERENSGYMGTSIIDQIEASYQNDCLKDVAENLTPEKLRVVMQQAAAWEDMTPEQLKEAFAKAETEDARLDYEYAKEQLAELEQTAKVTQDIYAVLEKYDIPNTMSNVMAMEAMIKNRNGMFRQIFGSGVKDADEEVQAEDLEEMKRAILEEFGEAVAAPEELAEVQEKLGTLAENVMKTMIESDEVTSLDVREMRLLSAQLSLGSLLAREEQYAVPVQTGDGIIGVSLKIVRGTDRKGIVDVMLESELHGKIAATFQAKEQGIKGLVATDHPETKELLEEQGDWLAGNLGEEEEANLHYAYISDLDLSQFSMGVFGVEADSPADLARDTEDYQVQTARLYRIAERFIQQLREVL